MDGVTSTDQSSVVPEAAESSLSEKLRSAQNETSEQRANTNRVFISYSRQDSIFVRRLVEALVARGIDAWVDWEDIPKTARWRDEIESGIEASDSFIFVLSPASILSVPCRNEIEHATKYNKRIVPVVCASVDPSECPPDVEQLNWIFLRPEDEFELGIAELMTALTTDLMWVHSHTHLLEQAIEWENKGRDRSLLLRGSSLRSAEAWLASAQDRDPTPTTLHSQYVLASRKAESARQRVIVVALAIGMAIATTLAVFALFQRQNAIQKQRDAEQAQALAVARAVTAEAASTRTQGLDGLETSTLLAIEAIHRIQTPPAVATLRQDMTLEAPTLWLQHKTSALSPAAFDPVAPVVAKGTDSGDVQIRAMSTGALMHTLYGAGTVQELLFGPHGRDLLVARGLSSIEIWRVNDWRRIATLAGMAFADYRFTPDGHYLVGQVSPRVLGLSPARFPPAQRVWDVVQNYKVVLQSKPGHEIDAIAVAPGGRYFAAAGTSTSNSAVVAILDRRHRQGPIVLHTASPLSQMSFTPKGEDLVGCDCLLSRPKNTVYVWSTRDWRQVRTLPDTGAATTGFALRFTPDGATMAREYQPAGSASSRIELWSVKNWTRRAILPSTSGTVHDFEFSPDGNFIAVAGDNLVRVWTVSPVNEALRLFLPETVTPYAQFGDRSNFLGTQSIDNGPHPQGTLRVWDVAHDGARQIENVLPTGGTSQLVFSFDGRKIQSAERSSFGHTVAASIWDIGSGQEGIHVRPTIPLCSDAFSPDGELLALSIPQLGTDVFNLKNGKRVVLFRHPACDEVVAMDRRHTLLAESGLTAYKQLRMMNLASQHQLIQRTYTNSVNAIAFSPNSRFLAVGTGSLQDNSVSILDGSQRWKEVATIAHAELLSEFSADGRYFAVRTGAFAIGSRNYGVKVIDTSTWRPIVSLPQDSVPSRAAFAPDGSFLVTGQDDGVVRVFTAASNWQVATQFELHTNISALAVSVDGAYIAVGAADGRTRIWLWNPTSLTQRACGFLVRNLTHAEWNLYVGSEPYRSTCPRLPVGP